MIRPPEDTPAPAPADRPAESATRTWRVGDLLKWTEQQFQKVGLDSPRLDAEVLLAHAMGISRLDLYTGYGQVVEEAERARFRALLTRRSRKEPIAYIIGHREFYSLRFEVNPSVLIPRPETEHLVECVLEAFPRATPVKPEPEAESDDEAASDEAEPSAASPVPVESEPVEIDEESAADPVPADPPLRILDLGTGSGILAVTLAVHRPSARVAAVDIQAEALEVARRNIAAHGVEERVRTFRGDLFRALPAGTRPFDIIVSNPPYIAPAEFAGLMPDVREFEPSTALLDDRGQDGLGFYREIIRESRPFLNPGTFLAFEVGESQAGSVEALLEEAGFREISRHRDLAGIARVVHGRAP